MSGINVFEKNIIIFFELALLLSCRTYMFSPFSLPLNKVTGEKKF